MHVRAYGLASMDRDAPADNHTGFPIGSCSKAFTACLAATLIDDGHFGWDDQLRKFLPDLKLYDPWVSEHVTFRDVLANRSGLSRASLAEYGSSLSWDEVLIHAAGFQLACGFRGRFAYCNVGFVLAAQAIQAAAGQSFEKLMRQRVFAAHGMGNTQYGRR